MLGERPERTLPQRMKKIKGFWRLWVPLRELQASRFRVRV